jgi:hypothetical protein
VRATPDGARPDAQGDPEAAGMATPSSRFAYEALTKDETAAKAPGVRRGKDGHVSLPGLDDLFAAPVAGRAGSRCGGRHSGGGEGWGMWGFSVPAGMFGCAAQRTYGVTRRMVESLQTCPACSSVTGACGWSPMRAAGVCIEAAGV